MSNTSLFILHPSSFILSLLLAVAPGEAFAEEEAALRKFPTYPREFALDRFKARRRAEEHPALIAGASAIEITPRRTKGVQIGGFGFNRRSQGVLDPLYARTIFLDDGRSSVALVSLDLLGFFYDDVLRVRSLVSRRHGDGVIICSTHNHQGPDTLGYYGRSLFMMLPVESGRDEGYMRWLIRRVAEGVEEAMRNSRPARVRVAEVEVPPGIQTNIRIPGHMDRMMGVMKFEDEDGENIATLVNLPLHAEVLWERNHLLSADFPGHYYRALEESWGGVALYFQGALGGMITANIPIHAPPKTLRRLSHRIGRGLADLARKAINETGVAVEVPAIEYRRRVLDFPMENDAFEFVHDLGVLTRQIPRREDGQPVVRTEAAVLRLGPVTMVTLPGEIFPSLGLTIKKMMDGEHRFILGLGNDELGYIMTEEEFKDPLYVYEQSMSIGPKTAGILLETLKGLLAGGK